ncbi:MAG: hypothetical protein J7M20_07625, partial [Deltaproteobacteria bacterium]|nr:hypothetical protein [Deltaproteobacteria bacterium]
FESSILKWFSYYRQSMILQILYISVDGEAACEKSEKRDLWTSLMLPDEDVVQCAGRINAGLTWHRF